MKFFDEAKLSERKIKNDKLVVNLLAIFVKESQRKQLHDSYEVFHGQVWSPKLEAVTQDACLVAVTFPAQDSINYKH